MCPSYNASITHVTPGRASMYGTSGLWTPSTSQKPITHQQHYNLTFVTMTSRQTDPLSLAPAPAPTPSAENLRTAAEPHFHHASLTSFELFPKLLIELRLVIWSTSFNDSAFPTDSYEPGR